MNSKKLFMSDLENRVNSKGEKAVPHKFVMEAGGKEITIYVIREEVYFGLFRKVLAGPCCYHGLDVIFIPFLWWKGLPREIIRVITYHEVGHLVFHQSQDGQRSLDKEHEADMYAVRKMQNPDLVIEALRHTHSFAKRVLIMLFDDDVSSRSRIEDQFNYRINNEFNDRISMIKAAVTP